MQLHPGVLRDHDPAIHAAYGPDQGHDIPVAAEFTRSLRPLLERFGHAEGFRMVLFTVDETVYSRELAPLAGVYPSVRLGAPWWFLDSPDGMRRFRELVTETAGFYNTSGFVDDTRAFLSIPARHDLARRIDAGYLAKLVVEHRLEEDDAFEVARLLRVVEQQERHALRRCHRPAASLDANPRHHREIAEGSQTWLDRASTPRPATRSPRNWRRRSRSDKMRSSKTRHPADWAAQHRLLAVA